MLAAAGYNAHSMWNFIGITGYEWFHPHASKPAVHEVGVWRLSPEAPFKALRPGEPFLLEIHAPRE